MRGGTTTSRPTVGTGTSAHTTTVVHQHPAKVEGNIVNHNQIIVVAANNRGDGIVIGTSGELDGNITNTSKANIIVNAKSATTAVHGIAVEDGGVFKEHIDNSGSIVVVATGAKAYGVYLSKVCADGTQRTDTNGINGQNEVKDNVDVEGRATAIGYDDEIGGGEINNAFHNDGAMTVTAPRSRTATTSAQARERRAWRMENSGPAASHHAFASFSNNGHLVAKAVATPAVSADGVAHAIGVYLAPVAGGGTEATWSAHAHLFNAENITALATAKNAELGTRRPPCHGERDRCRAGGAGRPHCR